VGHTWKDQRSEFTGRQAGQAGRRQAGQAGQAGRPRLGTAYKNLHTWKDPERCPVVVHLLLMGQGVHGGGKGETVACHEGAGIIGRNQGDVVGCSALDRVPWKLKGSWVGSR
jgi:hypothetical protein